ncbi:DNA damage-binding protein 2 isoform X4 [Alligator mississippiensis]|uniref:DNA damage-binding protein 2 isoform X4 n=1 Tax=Alligator mississippiensis TaxID=8496 RepID=UPI002877B26D|nr:DNA damage-binding protein 2 isoform X4 [Alligator mississippiensis]
MFDNRLLCWPPFPVEIWGCPDRMVPANQPKEKKHMKAHEHQPEEEAKSAEKRKRESGELENEPQAKRLFVRKAMKPPENTGWAKGGSTIRNMGVLFHQLKQHYSIIHYIYQNMLGGSIRPQLRQCLQLPFLRSLASYRPFRTASPFDRRVTCLEWHPTHPSTVAVGSKGGDIILWDYEVLNKTCFIKGMGAGGAITGMKFNPFNPSQLYTSSIAGTTTLQDFNGSTLRVFTSTEDWDFWYCSVDVSASCRTVVTGDNVGNVVLLSTGGDEIWKLKLHKKKVTHVEFNSRCDWLLATASVDQTVKIWDLRNIKDKTSFLHMLPHDKPVNAAYFSPTDGAKLLSTDQHSEIRVYSSSDWSKPQHLIPHPHRQFQHLTPIKVRQRGILVMTSLWQVVTQTPSSPATLWMNYELLIYLMETLGRWCANSMTSMHLALFHLISLTLWETHWPLAWALIF